MAHASRPHLEPSNCAACHMARRRCFAGDSLPEGESTKVLRHAGDWPGPKLKDLTTMTRKISRALGSPWRSPSACSPAFSSPSRAAALVRRSHQGSRSACAGSGGSDVRLGIRPNGRRRQLLRPRRRRRLRQRRRLRLRRKLLRLSACSARRSLPRQRRDASPPLRVPAIRATKRFAKLKEPPDAVGHLPAASAFRDQRLYDFVSEAGLTQRRRIAYSMWPF